MSDVTRLLAEAAAGDRQAAADLLPVVYDELRRLASVHLAAEPAGHTLQPTALVHEAYLRLVGPADGPQWDGRGHFFAAAARAMRHLLVENARRKKAQKRRRTRQDLTEAVLAVPEIREDLLALDDALDRLAAADPAAAELVHLRYFAGLTLPEAARSLDISPRSADRLWAYARAWLHAEMRDPDPEPGESRNPLA